LSASVPTPYDEVRYPGHPYAQTHPDHLATIGTLFGMRPAPVGECRVLEVACGDGANLVPAAYALPGSSFVGFDLAAWPIAAGRAVIERLGLQNITLLQGDLAGFDAGGGSFDYVIAHGLYSWIPPEAREALLALIAARLAPHGIAFVSYNCYPGCYVRRMAWEMLRFHTEHLAEPQARIAEARALVELLAGARSRRDVFGTMFDEELQRLGQRDAGHLFHDDLAAVNEPVYFHEFVDHADRHGLQFLGEAELNAMSDAGLTAPARHALAALDTLTREQYLDFIRCRRFRQTLLCRKDVALERPITAARTAGLLLSARSGARAADLLQRSDDTPRDEEARASAAPPEDTALLEAVLEELGNVFPRRLTRDELEERIRARPDAARLMTNGTDFYRRLVHGTALVGAVELHLNAPRFALAPGERPIASAVARLQLESGPVVTNLRHDSVRLDDAVPRQLLPLLDGTRDRAALAAVLGDALGPAQGRAATLDAHLDQLAKLALLVA